MQHTVYPRLPEGAHPSSMPSEAHDQGNGAWAREPRTDLRVLLAAARCKRCVVGGAGRLRLDKRVHHIQLRLQVGKQDARGRQSLQLCQASRRHGRDWHVQHGKECARGGASMAWHGGAGHGGAGHGGARHGMAWPEKGLA